MAEKSNKQKIMEMATGSTISGEPPNENFEARDFKFEASKVKHMLQGLGAAAKGCQASNEDTIIACMIVIRKAMELIMGGKQGIEIETFNLRQVIAMLDELDISL